MLRILAHRGAEYCGKAELYDYQVYLALNNIEHTKPRYQRYLRVFPQDHLTEVLSGDFTQEDLSV